MPAPTPLATGQTAPDFSFQEEDKTVHLSDITSHCLLYFYPKDDTPGCTKEACAIRDHWSDFEAAGLKVVGVSKDPEKSHDKFRMKYQLPFPLASDTDLSVARAYGVFGEKKFMGKVYDAIHRMSFLIGPEKKILKVYLKVKPDAHAEEVLEDLKQLKDK